MKIWVIEPEKESLEALLKEQITRLRQEMGIAPLAASDVRLRVERRLFPRIPCFLLVDFVAQGCAYRAFIRNISADGAFIESQRPAPPGSDVTLVISRLDDESPIKIAGDIVWMTEEGIGVKFNPVADFPFHKLPL